MSEPPDYRKLYAPMVGVALAVIAADQITKHFATGLGSCQDPASRPETIGLCLAHNEGMAFSVGWGSGAIISAVAVTIVVVLFVVARKMPLHARLLMGAIANLAPDLFAGILADVPFVDALTTILDPSLPLTVIEWDEWGDPLHDAEVYAYMKTYTPYENVRAGVDYPRILATTSLNDTRVYYVEPAKWVARLREVGADALLKCEMVAGHGGVSGRYNSWHQRAFELAWLLDVLGLADA